MKQFLFFLYVVLNLLLAQAQEVIDVKKVGQIESTDPAAAKQKLMEDAISQITFQSVQGMIGEAKTERSKAIIENKIIKNSNKYILSIRGQGFERKGSNYEMETEMKVSLKNLRSLLLENGLLYQMEGVPKVLPMIQLIDRVVGQSYGWWYQAPTKEQLSLAENLGPLNRALRSEFEKIGFFNLSPIEGKFASSMPETFRGENLQRADYLFLGDFFKSSIILRGQVIYQAKASGDNVYSIDVRLEALHSSNGRLMAEISRTYTTEAGSAAAVLRKKMNEVAPRITEDLSAQLAESWKKGTFGSSVYRLTLVGPVSPYDVEEFKKMLVLKVNDIKNVRDRLFEARRTTFEVDSSVLPQQLAQTFRATHFAKYKVVVEDVTSDGLTIKVEASN